MEARCANCIWFEPDDLQSQAQMALRRAEMERRANNMLQQNKLPDGTPLSEQGQLFAIFAVSFLREPAQYGHRGCESKFGDGFSSGAYDNQPCLYPEVFTPINPS